FLRHCLREVTHELPPTELTPSAASSASSVGACLAVLTEASIFATICALLPALADSCRSIRICRRRSSSSTTSAAAALAAGDIDTEDESVTETEANSLLSDLCRLISGGGLEGVGGASASGSCGSSSGLARQAGQLLFVLCKENAAKVCLTQFPALVHSLQIPCHSTSPTATASGSSLDAYSSDSSEEEILDPEVSVATCCSQSQPIKSLNELAAWRPGQTVRQPSALAPREDLPTSSPRVLVCHDMQGGYLDDAYLYGNANASAFRLFHWHLIDSHGVPCLGTFIAEWDSGLEAMRQLLSNEKDAIGWADRLIDLADAGGFDGWLINVEVALPAELVPALQAFVRRLKS
uniref:Mannosyl-glycoprotein endo-beta-N-acetylglucosaminidase n=1 Tax=Macrostomum lignano TaxID=282301 RepID=A0A1I8F9C1_9PLAT